MSFKKFSVKALALVMTLAMFVAVLAPVVSAVNADQENDIVYVSLGDSMTNGYGFDGYNQGNNTLEQFLAGEGVYGEDTYADQFAAWLEENGKDVEHIKLAVSAMRPEDLLYFLGGGEMPKDRWWFDGAVDYAVDHGYESEATMEALREYYQESIEKADVITLGIGNASFGAYLMQYLTNLLGVLGGGFDEDEYAPTFADALDMLEDDAQKQVVGKVYDMMMGEFGGYLTGVEGIDLEKMCDAIAYVTASFIINYKKCIERIVEINPDVEIIQVGLMSTLSGIELSLGEDEPNVPFGDVMDGAFGLLNAYVAGLPTVLQLAGECADATFYYAAQPHPKYIADAYDDLAAANWGSIDCGSILCGTEGHDCEGNGRLSGTVVRDRTVESYNSSLRLMIGQALLGYELPAVTLEMLNSPDYPVDPYTDTYIKGYDPATGVTYQVTEDSYIDIEVDPSTFAVSFYTVGGRYLSNAQDNVVNTYINERISVSIYRAIEAAVVESVGMKVVPLDSMLGVATDIMGAIGEFPEALAQNPGPNEIFVTLEDFFTGSEKLLGMCKVYGMFKIGNGMSVHPTPAGHDELANVVIEAYAHGHTSADETKQNVMIALNAVAALVDKYYDEAVAYAMDYVTQKGYVALVDEAIDSALATLDALGVVTADMDAAIKADIKAEIERTVAALEALRAAVVDAKIQTVEDFTATVAAIKAEISAYVANVKAIVEASGIDADVVDAIEAVKAAIDEVSVVANRVAAAPAVIDEAIASVGELAVVAAGLADVAIKEAVDAEIDATVATLVALKAALAGIGYDAVEDVTAIVADYKAELADRLATIEELMAQAGASEDDLAKVRNAIALVQDGIVPATDSVLGANGVVARALAVVNALKAATANTDAAFKAAADAEVARTLAVLANLAATLDAVNDYTTEEFNAIVADVVAELEACLAAAQVLLDKAELAANAIYAAQNTAKAIVNDVFNATVVLVTNVNDITYDFLYNKMGATYDELVAAINAAAHELNPARLAALNNWLKNASSEVVALIAANGGNVYVLAARLQEIMGEDEAVKGAVAALGVVAGLVYEYYEEAYIFGYNYALMNGYVSVAVDAIDDAIAAVNALDLSTLGLSAELEAAVAAELAATVATLSELKAALENNDANTVDGLVATVAALSDDLAAHVAAITAACEQAGVDVNVLVIIPHIEEYVIPTIEEAKAKLEAYYEEGVAYVDGYVADAKVQIAATKAAVEAAIAELEAAVFAENAELQAALTANLNALLAKLAEYDAFFADVQIKTQEELAAFIANFEREINNCIANIDALVAELEALAAGLDAQAKYQVELVIAIIKGEITAAVDAAVAAVKASVAAIVDQINDYLYAMIEEAYNQLVDVLAGVAAKLNFPLVKEFYNWLVNYPEDMLNILAEISYGHIEHVGEAILAAFENFYRGITTGEYGVGIDSYYVAIADYDNTYADLFAAALELGNDQYSKLDWNNVDLGELVKADLITIGYNESKLAGFAIDQAIGAAKNYVDVELRAAALAYADGLIDKVVDEIFNREDLFADIIANLNADAVAGVNGAIDAIVNNALIADKDYVELDWAALVGEDNLAYVDQYRAELRETLIANGVAETVSFEINAVELLLADEATREALEAQLENLVTGGLDAIVEIIGEDAMFTIEIPVVDFAVIAAESYAYNYLVYTAKYAELVVTAKLVNPNATVILLGNHNPVQGLTIALGDKEIDLGDAYTWLTKATAVQSSIYALTTGATFVDITGAQTNYAAAVEGGMIDNSVVSFLLAYLANDSVMDLSAAGHAYVKDQIMNAMTFYCVHNFAPATCTEPQICTLCGETNGTPNGHNWTDADCTNPRHCVDCGASFGVALGHTWADATCTDPKTCTVCGETEGEALGHDWNENNTCDRCDAVKCDVNGHVWAGATCTDPKTCTVCGETEGNALGHTPGAAATCTTAQTCTVCGCELAAALGHTPGAAATCTTAQNCTVCGCELVAALGHTAGAAATCTTAQTCTVCGCELVAALGHTFANDCDADCDVCGATRTPSAHIAGEWTVTKEATKKEEGTKSTKCVVCGAEMTETIPMLEKGLSTGGIVAIVVSSVVVLGGGAAAAWFFIIKKKRIV